MVVKNLIKIQFHGSPFPRFDLSTSMNSSDQQRQLTLSNSDIKQDIDSSYALGSILLKQTVIKHFVQGQISGKGPTPLSDSWVSV